MSDIAIRVEHVSKRYRLGEREPYKSLRDVIARAAAAPVHWSRRKGQPATGSNDGYLWALEDISFEIHQGEAVGIIGRNGAGKSTLLKILSRISKPTKGQAQIYGRVGSLLEVGTGFHPELTGRENIFLNGAILGMKRKEIERKFDEIVAFAEIEKFLDTPVKRYSSGMYVRLAFAVAAHLEPEILLVDEVLAVGDARFQQKCLGKMGDVTKEGRTVLFVSHNMEAVARLCDVCQLFDNGHLLEYGSTLKVVQKYLEGRTNVGALWERPKDQIDTRKRVQILLIALINNEGKLSSVINFDEQTRIKIESIFHYNVKGVSFLIIINNAMGLPILNSQEQDANSGISIDHSAGSYKTECLLPTGFLKPGQYTVTVGVNQENIARLDRLEDIIRFEISDVNNPGANGRPGAISPRLQWRTVT